MFVTCTFSKWFSSQEHSCWHGCYIWWKFSFTNSAEVGSRIKRGMTQGLDAIRLPASRWPLSSTYAEDTITQIGCVISINCEIIENILHKELGMKKISPCLESHVLTQFSIPYYDNKTTAKVKILCCFYTEWRYTSPLKNYHQPTALITMLVLFTIWSIFPSNLNSDFSHKHFTLHYFNVVSTNKCFFSYKHDNMIANYCTLS